MLLCKRDAAILCNGLSHLHPLLWETLVGHLVPSSAVAINELLRLFPRSIVVSSGMEGYPSIRVLTWRFYGRGIRVRVCCQAKISKVPIKLLFLRCIMNWKLIYTEDVFHTRDSLNNYINIVSRINSTQYWLDNRNRTFFYMIML